jgi:hypothetical protein
VCSGAVDPDHEFFMSNANETKQIIIVDITAHDPFRVVVATSVLMSPRPTLRAFSFVALAGCGLDLAGEQFVRVADTPSGTALNPPGIEATDAGSLAAQDGGVIDAEAAFGLDAGLMQQRATATSPDAIPPALDGDGADAYLPADADMPEVAAVLDGATKDAAQDGAGGGGTACDRLMLCCKRLVAPLPSEVLVCIAGAQQADGGDAGACESLLATFQGMASCP